MSSEVQLFVNHFLAAPSPKEFPRLLQVLDSQDPATALFLLQALGIALLPDDANVSEQPLAFPTLQTNADTDPAVADAAAVPEISAAPTEIDVVDVLGLEAGLKLFYAYLRCLLVLTSPSLPSSFVTSPSLTVLRRAATSSQAQSVVSSPCLSVFQTQGLVVVSFLHSVEIASMSLSLCERFLHLFGDDAVATETGEFFHFVHFVILTATTPSIEDAKLKARQAKVLSLVQSRLPVWTQSLRMRFQFTSLELLTPFLFIMTTEGKDPESPSELNNETGKPRYSHYFHFPIRKDSGLPFLILPEQQRMELMPSPIQLRSLSAVKTDPLAEVVLHYFVLSALAFRLCDEYEWELLIWTALRGLHRQRFGDHVFGIRAYAAKMGLECIAAAKLGGCPLELQLMSVESARGCSRGFPNFVPHSKRDDKRIRASLLAVKSRDFMGLVAGFFVVPKPKA
eukprot:Gregarina_sp_Poly_1__444@NODE_1107_length_5080_cov_147_992021_g767_i0_p1_GENE_NODE_1107_length_5080_cov_147_992021_g767_i0NODE_1107_length_5080_cov_147_992021_g767_i0_p1_ORF_typecomplete_len453_score82_48_NODE_1107_length_5080_cov_147_992021_g767_i0931451